VSSATENSAGLLTITGTAEPGSTVTVIYTDNTSAIGTADASGNYSIISPSAQGVGTESVTVTDAAGNTSVPTSEQWTGSTPETTPATIGAVNQNSDGMLTVTGSAPAGDQVTVTFGDGTSATGIADNTGHYSVSSSTAQTAGTETAVFTDSAGEITTLTSNWAGSSATPPPVGATPPSQIGICISSITPDTPVPGGDAVATSHDSITSLASTTNDQLTIGGAIGSDLGTGQVLQVSMNGGTSWQNVPNANIVDSTPGSNSTMPTWSMTETGVQDGTYDVMARVVNSGTGASVTPASSTVQQQVVVDSTAPTETVAYTGASGPALTPTFTGTLSGPLETTTNTQTAETLQISLNGGATWAAVPDTNITPNSNGTETWTYTYGSAFPALSYGQTIEVQLRVVDAAGNVGKLLDPPYEPTQTASVTSAVMPDTGGTAADPNGSGASTGDLNISGALSTALESGQSLEIRDNGTVVGTVAAASITGTSWADTIHGVGQGLHNITAEVVNADGTTGPASSALAVNVNNTASGETVTLASQVAPPTEGALNLSLQDVLSDVKALSLEGAAAQQVTINGGGGVVTTVNLAEGVGAGAGQWQDTGTSTVNGVLYDVYHNTAEGTNTAADLLIQHGIHVI
jgi:hypothetical protein